MPKPPIAGICDQVPNGPCEVFHQKTLHVTDLTVARLDMVSLDCIAAAQVRIPDVRRWLSQVALVTVVRVSPSAIRIPWTSSADHEQCVNQLVFG
jgi:hypothetical protein